LTIAGGGYVAFSQAPRDSRATVATLWGAQTRPSLQTEASRPSDRIYAPHGPQGSSREYSQAVTQRLYSRLALAGGRYAEVAPAATSCCNACRTCAISNVLALVSAAGVVAVAGLTGFAKRIARSF
jgi:hypothetical protein